MNISSIFLVTHTKEYYSGRLIVFLKNLLKTELNNIRIIIFINDNIHSDILHEINDVTEPLNSKIIFYDDNKKLTEVMFNSVFQYKLDHKTILLLETDCALKKNFLEIINNDISKLSDDKIFYGSFYYGNLFNQHVSRFHINGVCVYNRTKKFLNLLKKINLKENYKNNYDWVIFKELQKDVSILLDTVDSNFILNLSHEVDTKISLNYKYYKSDTCILHTKNKDLLKDLI